MKKFIYISILFCLTAIILGAFGSHLLKEILSKNKLTSFETGIRYQMFHGLTILMLSLNNCESKTSGLSNSSQVSAITRARSM